MALYDTLNHALTDNAEQPFRVRQRLCALYLGYLHLRDGFAHKELREVCKKHDAYNGPNFSRYLKLDSEYFTGSTKLGWVLTEKGKAEARRLFAGEVPTIGVEPTVEPVTDRTCDGDPDENEAAFDPECPVHAIEPEAPKLPSRPPRISAANALAALFHQIEDEGK